MESQRERLEELAPLFDESEMASLNSLNLSSPDPKTEAQRHDNMKVRKS